MEVHYTKHALLRMTKRAIEPEWVEWVIQNPALRLDDENAGLRGQALIIDI